MCQRWDIDVYAATPHLAYAMVSTVWSKNPSCIQFIALGDGAYFFVGHGRTWRSLGSGGGALQCQQTVDGIPLAAMDAFLCSRTELRATESCTPFAAQEAMASQFPTESSLLQSYEDPVTGKLVNPVIVTCRDVTHDGVPDMIARISSGGSAGIGAWEVFTKSRGHWRWIGGSLKDGSTDLQVLPNEEIQMTTAGIFRNGDAHCCPSGGWVHARYRWNGSAFVVVKRWTIRT